LWVGRNANNPRCPGRFTVNQMVVPAHLCVCFGYDSRFDIDRAKSSGDTASSTL